MVDLKLMLLKIILYILDILPYITIIVIPLIVYRILNKKNLEENLNSKSPISIAVCLGIFLFFASFINNESAFVSSAGLFLASIVLAFFIVLFQDFMNLKTNKKIDDIHRKLLNIEGKALKADDSNEIQRIEEVDNNEVQKLEEDIFLKQKLVSYYKIQLLEEDIRKKKNKKKVLIEKLQNKEK